MNIKFALIDNDYVVQAKTDFLLEGQDNPLRKFLEQIQEELLPGQTGYLEIEDFEKDPVTFDSNLVSDFEKNHNKVLVVDDLVANDYIRPGATPKNN